MRESGSTPVDCDWHVTVTDAVGLPLSATCTLAPAVSDAPSCRRTSSPAALACVRPGADSTVPLVKATPLSFTAADPACTWIVSGTARTVADPASAASSPPVGVGVHVTTTSCAAPSVSTTAGSSRSWATVPVSAVNLTEAAGLGSTAGAELVHVTVTSAVGLPVSTTRRDAPGESLCASTRRTLPVRLVAPTAYLAPVASLMALDPATMTTYRWRSRMVAEAGSSVPMPPRPSAVQVSVTVVSAVTSAARAGSVTFWGVAPSVVVKPKEEAGLGSRAVLLEAHVTVVPAEGLPFRASLSVRPGPSVVPSTNSTVWFGPRAVPAVSARPSAARAAVPAWMTMARHRARTVTLCVSLAPTPPCPSAEHTTLTSVSWRTSPTVPSLMSLAVASISVTV